MEFGRCNQCVKVYGSHLKITTFNYPIYNPNGLPVETKKREDYSKVKDFTRTDSIKRGVEKVFDIAYLNDFDYFVTLTLSPKFIDRTDISLINKKVKKWCSNLVQRKNCKYLLIPEFHADNKSIHFHGLLSGDFNLVDSGLFTKKNQVIYNLADWNLGFTTCIKLDDNKVAVSRYICKYITKDTKKIFGNFYLAGGKLNREVPKEYFNKLFYEELGKVYDVGNTQLKVKYYEVDR